MKSHFANYLILFIGAVANISLAAELISAYMDQEPRQVGVTPAVGVGASAPPLAPAQLTLPSNYWWPYASWGATTTGATATLSTLSMPISTSATYQASPMASLSTPSPSSPVSTTDSASNSTPSTASDISTTSTTSSSESPSPTPTASPQQAASRRPLNDMPFFVPLFAVVGGLVAAVIVWVLCRSCMDRRKRNMWRTASSSSTYRRRDPEKGWRRYEEMQSRRGWWSSLFSRREPVERVVPGPRYVGIDGANLPSSEKGLLEGPHWVGPNDADDGLPSEECETVADQVSSLLPSQPKKVGRTQTKLLRKPPTTSSASSPPIHSRSTSLAFLELYDNDGEGDDEKRGNEIPWESLRHKSIKRAILAKVDEEKKWTDSMRGIRAVKAALAGFGSIGDVTLGRRQTHIRTDSDSHIVTGGGVVEGALSKSMNRTRPTRAVDGEGPGFRIMVESPPAHVPTLSKTWSLTSSFPFLSNAVDSDSDCGNDSQASEDRYTPIPTRMRSGSRSHGSTSPAKVRPSEAIKGNDISSMAGGRIRQSTSRPPPHAPSAAALLRSPPHVMTPQMENALCFTPIPASSSKMGPLLTNYGVAHLDTITDAPETPTRKSMNVPRSAVESVDPGINAPRPGPYRGQLSTPDNTDGSIFTRTYRVRTDRAMRRVESIVESGWNERGPTERARVGGSTDFGRVT